MDPSENKVRSLNIASGELHVAGFPLLRLSSNFSYAALDSSGIAGVFRCSRLHAFRTGALWRATPRVLLATTTRGNHSRLRDFHAQVQGWKLLPAAEDPALHPVDSSRSCRNAPIIGRSSIRPPLRVPLVLPSRGILEPCATGASLLILLCPRFGLERVTVCFDPS